MQPTIRIQRQLNSIYAASGISGLETCLGLSLGLVHEGVIGLNELLKRFTVNPARLLGLSIGELTPGRDADICIFNPELEWEVNKAILCQRAKTHHFMDGD
jgi:dihydroorotase